MDWQQTIFEAIDMRSFSNLWFWIALAVVWSSASHWVLGVPYDMVVRARRNGGQAEGDLHDMVRVNVSRILYIAEISGLWLVCFAFFLLSALAILGWAYWIEFAQAVFLLVCPMAFVGGMSIRTAARIQAQAATGEALYRRLTRHRITVQALGMVAIFITAVWGMYVNLRSGVIPF